jgi:hypothetical protein
MAAEMPPIATMRTASYSQGGASNPIGSLPSAKPSEAETLRHCVPGSRQGRLA